MQILYNTPFPKKKEHFSVFKNATSDELSQQGIVRYEFVIDFIEVFGKFEQAIGLDEILLIRTDLFQRIFSETLEHAKLVGQFGVEDKVGAFQMGIDPFIFATTYRWPHGQGLFRRGIAEIEIANNTAQKPEIGQVDRCVVVDIDLREWRDIDLVFLLLGNELGQLIVQGMDAFNDDWRLLIDNDRIEEGALLGREVEDG